MRYAIIEEGIVSNIVEAEADFAKEKGWVEATDGVQMGWTHSGKAFARPVPPLPVAKLASWDQAKAKRDAMIDGGVAVPGIGTFDSDEASRVNIIGAVVMAQIALANSQPFSIKWTLADNSVVELDAAKMIAVGAVVFQHVAGVHMAAQSARAAIEAAEDRAELATVDVDVKP